MGESKPNDDPLAEAMSMLDAVANGSKDFEDFAIDSEEDSNDDANLLDDLNLTNDLVDLGLDDSRDTAISSDAPYDVRNYGGEGGATGFKAAGGKRGNALPAPTGTNIDQFSGEAFVHPLQMMGVKELDPLSQVGLHAPGAGASATNSYPEVNNRVLGNVVPSGAATVAAATTTSAAAAAAAGTTSWSNFSSNFASLASRAAASVQSVVETAEAQVLGNAPSSSPRTSTPSAGGFSTTTTFMPPANTAASNMTYQERQRLLHQQYHAANPAATINNINTAPSNIVSRSSQTSLSTTSSARSNTSSPTKLTTTMTETQSQHSTSNLPITFLDKLTTNLDTPTKTKLIASALGNLLPGERVIMFLNSLRDVKDSRFPMMLVGSSNVMSAGLKDVLGIYNDDDLDNGVELDSEEGEGESVATVWCCVMTFYRVAVFSYRATVSEGKVLFNDVNESSDVQDNKLKCDESSNESNRVIQQWIQSQNVSIQFQVAHDGKDRRQTQHHHVFEMPLASIERVEKVLSSSQASITGVAPSSSLNSYSPYQSILPSASTVSSASSAMSQLGSQMKPLLGSMTAAASSGNATPNMLASNSSASGNNTNAIGASSGPLGIILHGKDGGRWIKFSTNSYSDAMRAHEALNTYAFPGRRNLGYLFAFESRRAEVMACSAQQQREVSGQGTVSTAPTTPRRFVPLEEFERQGIFSFRGNDSNKSASPWAPILNANANYGLCATYPSVLVGPRSIVGDDVISDTVLRRCAAFRSEGRFPTLTWGSAIHGGSIWRSSQPKVGLQGNRSMEDERYLYAIGEEAKRANLAADARSEGGIGRGTGKPPKEFLRMLCGRNNESDLILEGASTSCMLKIMDMRPKSAAMANRTQGYGYENTNYYRGTTINFYGIGNIHAVRDAYQKINALCISPNTSDFQWMQLVENSNWPSMTRLILSASWQTAYHVHYNRLPVLLHCSHGWDRTSQVAALAQLMLDPHYRTIKGFSTLVEKDFMSFGHPFHTRCGHGEGKNEQGGDEGQLSPIFLQFLDCVFQLINQFPDYFEFNTRYLLLLSEHVYSCRFGTLLCDSEREREVVAGTRQRTYCLWEYLDSIPQLINPTFNRISSKEAGALFMPLPMLLRNVSLWTDRFCMYGAKATIPCVPPGLWQYPLDYTAKSGEEQPLVLHTSRGPGEGLLGKALDDVYMWKEKALVALEELEKLKKKVDEGQSSGSHSTLLSSN
ncbi:hypothetical protein ACHAWX_005598 [Stephanocyclus meneghinianus]